MAYPHGNERAYEGPDHSQAGEATANYGATRIEHELDQLENLFTYHAPTGEQRVKYTLLRSAAKNFAAMIIAEVSPSFERDSAISAVRQAVMWANSAIACNR